MNLKTLILLIFLSMGYVSVAQQNNSLTAKKITGTLKIDGIIDEPEWNTSEEASNFRMNFPSDSAFASSKTSVKVLYNDSYLYISGHVLNATANAKPYVVSSLKRDFVFLENDAFGIILDPFNDHSNGYGFYVSALGVQRDEQINNGLTADATWDIKWYSAVQRNADGYVVEMAIPFRYLRFSKSLPAWNINFLRNDVSNNERSSWAPTPRNFLFPNLSYSGSLAFPELPKQTPNNISLIPSVTFNASQLKQDDINTKLKPSLDAKVTLTSSLNLDLTLNPDFSQAEVDDAQVNLGRFELSYPEKRLFFIENSDLFSAFGVSNDGSATLRPFYSRRIGLKQNPLTGQFEQTSIVAGARLSGKLTPNLRLGLMNIQTGGLNTADTNGTKAHYPGENFSVLALQQKVFSSSNIGFIFTNRQSFAKDSIGLPNYNRLAGLEYNLISRNGQWTGKVFEHVMFGPGKTSTSEGGFLNLSTRRTASFAGFSRAGKDFAPEIGFIPRNNFTNLYGEFSYITYPNSSFINNIQPVVHYKIYVDSAFNRTDHFYKGGFLVNFKNTALLYALFVGDYTKLQAPFNPSMNDGLSLPAGTAYNYRSMAFYYLSDARTRLYGEYYMQVGQYFNGTIAQFSGYLNYKFQPYGRVGVKYNASFIRLPQPYKGNDVLAIGPQTEISFSKKLFLNTNIQYTNLNSNLNYFVRVQWRFRPLSDLYVVYSNNQNTDLRQRQNQSLIVKFIYFL
nr:DUF5916 domain-containing protein [uncultured Mucilaginibacter sp.]